MGGGGGRAGLWGGETIEGLALPALGGAELTAPETLQFPLNLTRLLFTGALSLLAHLFKSCQVRLSAGSLPELISP